MSSATTDQAASTELHRMLPFVAEMPHGGFKHSGHGKDLSRYRFEDDTRIKHVMGAIG